jgi:hypothetical protein
MAIKAFSRRSYQRDVHDKRPPRRRFVAVGQSLTSAPHKGLPDYGTCQNGFSEPLIGSNRCVSPADTVGSISEYLRLRSRARRRREMDSRTQKPQPKPIIRQMRVSTGGYQSLRRRRRARISKAPQAASNPGTPAMKTVRVSLMRDIPLHNLPPSGNAAEKFV